MLGARFSKRMIEPLNPSGTMPVGPFRCLAQMTSARPLFSGLSRL